MIYFFSEFESSLDFSSDDIVLSTLALGCIGDAYMELGDVDNALNSYKDATANSENEFTKPIYMFKQAMIHEQNGDYDDAIEIYNDIKLNFTTSREANGIEKYISRAENR